MASLLRQIIAGPRQQHADTGLDLCYVTEDIIVTYESLTLLLTTLSSHNSPPAYRAHNCPYKPEANRPLSSGPSNAYPKMAYRTPVSQLVSYLDKTHGTSWAIWEFRAEGTGYPDDAVHNRILHFPFPDHHPPPFRLVPGILASMRNWLAGGELQGQRVTGVRRENGVQSRDEKAGEASEEPGEEVSGKEEEGEGKGKGNGRVIVVHCKAGKGRSGTMSTAFLIAERNWAAADALARFTERRMRPGFGQGVSIPSQQRWVAYVDRWAHHGRRYVERRAQVLEVHVWGVRDGVRIEVEGFVDEGKKIKPFHRFTHDERTVVDGPDMGVGVPNNGSGAESESEVASASESVSSSKSRVKKAKQKLRTSILFSQAAGRLATQPANPAQAPTSPASSSPSQFGNQNEVVSPPEATTPSPGQAIILRPSKDVVLPTNDVKVSVQRRSRQRQFAPSIITTVAHVWFNAFFEGKGPELGTAEESGVFEVAWDQMDGLKGFMRVGSRAFDRMAVVWRAVGDEEVVRQAGVEEDVGGVPAANWRGEEKIESSVEAEAEREVVSKGDVDVGAEMEEGERAGLKTSGPEGENIDGKSASKDLGETSEADTSPSVDSNMDHARDSDKTGDVKPGDGQDAGAKKDV